jgi:hypothetical protein
MRSRQNLLLCLRLPVRARLVDVLGLGRFPEDDRGVFRILSLTEMLVDGAAIPVAQLR